MILDATNDDRTAARQGAHSRGLRSREPSNPPFVGSTGLACNRILLRFAAMKRKLATNKLNGISV
jgi:hypothetical protein